MEIYFPEFLLNFNINSASLMQILFSAMISILFIQSGLDKVFNWQGELSFYKDHFKKSILKGTEALLMPVITIFELAAGFLSVIGIFEMLITGNKSTAFWGMLLASLSIIQLFFGQRLAKDYAGAGSLVPYFLLTAAGLYFYIF